MRCLKAGEEVGSPPEDMGSSQMLPPMAIQDSIPLGKNASLPLSGAKGEGRIGGGGVEQMGQLGENQSQPELKGGLKKKTPEVEGPPWSY